VNSEAPRCIILFRERKRKSIRSRAPLDPTPYQTKKEGGKEFDREKRDESIPITGEKKRKRPVRV